MTITHWHTGTQAGTVTASLKLRLPVQSVTVTVSNGPVRLIRHDTSSTVSGTLDRLRKLDMVQHCKWIAHGTDGLGGKGCTRMRPKLHLRPVLGHAFRVYGVMAGGIVRHLELEGCVVSHRYIRE